MGKISSCNAGTVVSVPGWGKAEGQLSPCDAMKRSHTLQLRPMQPKNKIKKYLKKFKSLLQHTVQKHQFFLGG